MSDNLPPSSPPPSGPPPSGPPPSGPPPVGPPGAEYLERGSGGPMPAAQPGTSGGGRKKALIAGGSLLGLAVVAGGAFGAYWYLSSGPQPAEALPDTTFAYASIDLDPSGAQKIEALRTLKKFPAINDQLDFNAEDDIRQRLFEEFEKDLDCPSLDYGDDIAPWLGDRAAVAAVDLGGDSPTPVVVVQVKDADKADAGLTAIQDCATQTGGDGSGGWSINGDWAVIAESDDVAQQVADAADKASLADDDTYQKWTDEAGGQGIVTMYAAPAAGSYLADSLDNLMTGGMFGGSYCAYSSTDSDGGDCSSSSGSLLPDDVRSQLEGFKGAAASVRFDNGSLELELASDATISEASAYSEGRGDDVLATLPDDTAAALGVGFADGWFGDLVDRLASYSGGSQSADDLIAQMEADTGLDLPADAETLAGESASLSFGGDFDPETLVNSTDGSGVPVALKVKGDAEAIQGVLAKVQATFTDSAEGNFLSSDTNGDLVAIGPDSDYRSQVLEDGHLGDSEVFKDVVPDADRADAILFVNFDAGDWLVNLASGDTQAEDNLKPLSGAGISTYRDGDVSHTLLRITTN